MKELTLVEIASVSGSVSAKCDCYNRSGATIASARVDKDHGSCSSYCCDSEGAYAWFWNGLGNGVC